MSENDDNAHLRVPENTILMHGGHTKTGTSYLQYKAAELRPQLSASGVLYPGAQYSQYMAGRYLLWKSNSATEELKRREHWTAVVEEIRRSDCKRVWFEDETLSKADDAALTRVYDNVTTLGKNIHIVFTVRNFQRSLASRWQQDLKNGILVSFDEWLEITLSESQTTRSDYDYEAYRRSVSPDVYERWASYFGADNITVIVVDKEYPTRVDETFERLLGLPDGLLTETDVATVSNRSMSMEEAELIRSFSRELSAKFHDWKRRKKILIQIADELIASRSPSASEQKIYLPEWAEAPAREWAETVAAGIQKSGVRVIGNLDALSSKPETVASTPTISSLPMDVAAKTLAILEGLS